MASNPKTTEVDLIGIAPARLNTLVDGIFAVVMTLLVFDLKVPEIELAMVSTQLIPRFLELIPNFSTYFISFAILGIFWVGHHNFFHYVRRVDRPILWLNILFMALIAIVPFSTSLLAKYGSDSLVLAWYGLNFVVVGIVLFVGWNYATNHHRLVDRSLSKEFIEHVKILVGISPIVYGFAALMSFIFPLVSWLVYAGLPIYYIFQTHTDKIMQAQWKHEKE